MHPVGVLLLGVLVTMGCVPYTLVGCVTSDVSLENKRISFLKRPIILEQNMA